MIYLTTRHSNLSFHIIHKMIPYYLYIILAIVRLNLKISTYVISISFNYGHLACAPTIYHFIRLQIQNHFSSVITDKDTM